eukprot:EG_transcript_54746
MVDLPARHMHGISLPSRHLSNQPEEGVIRKPCRVCTFSESLCFTNSNVFATVAPDAPSLFSIIISLLSTSFLFRLRSVPREHDRHRDCLLNCCLFPPVAQR